MPSRRQRATTTAKATTTGHLAVRGDRIIAKASLMRQERDMARTVLGAIQQYLRLVRRAVATTRITAAAPLGPDDDPDFTDVDLNGLDQSAAWPAILQKTILPEITEILTGLGPQQYMTPTVANAVNAWRAQWLQQRTVALAGVPDTITSQIRNAIQADAELRGPNPQAAAAIVKDLLNPDAPTWKSRAQTIARTEVVGANNQGGLASYTAIHQSLAPLGGQVFKTWLATEDRLTRPDHAAVDGTELGVSDTFSVGGSQMTGPGDESADPAETINCRCTLTWRVDDGTDAATDDASVDESLLAAGAPNTGVAIMLGLGPTSEQECSAEGVEVEAPGLHCTVGFLANPSTDYTPEQQQALITALAEIKPEGTADAFATAHFNPDDEDRDPCAVLLVQSEWLSQLHDDVQSAITAAGLTSSTTFPIWIPHIAIAYNADPSIIPPAAVGSTIQFNRLVVGWGDQQIIAAGDGSDTSEDDITDSPADLMAAALEATMTAPVPVAPPQADDTPSEAAPASPPGAVQWSGVLAVLDQPSSDGRMIASAGFTWRQLPLPLSYQAEGEHGGDMAGTTVIVGRILTCKIEGSNVVATGDFFDAMYDVSPQNAIQQVAGGIGCVSVDLPVQIMSYLAPGPDGSMIPVDPMQYIGDYDAMVMLAEQSELAGATIVNVPAFAAARIEIVNSASMPNLAPVTADAATPSAPVLTSNSITMPDGTVLKVGDQVNIVDAEGNSDPTIGLIEAIDPDANTVTVAVEDPDNPGQTNTVSVDPANIAVVTSMSNDQDTAASGAASGAGGLTAAAFAEAQIEHKYPADWFEPVVLDAPTALTVTPEGRVYGHLAVFGTCHTGYGAQCVTPPTSPSGYAYFHVGEAETTTGPIPVGKLTVGGGHAAPKVGWRGATEHYDNAGAAVAVVRAHEDEHGIQVTGAILPTASKDQVAALRRSPLSGDWRAIGGHHELVAALSVNVPGFPVPRAALAASGRVESLVAAGVVHAAPGTGEPEPGGLNLPSGARISGDDLAVLASAFADVLDQRAQDTANAQRRADTARDMRLSLLHSRLNMAV